MKKINVEKLTQGIKRNLKVVFLSGVLLLSNALPLFSEFIFSQNITTNPATLEYIERSIEYLRGVDPNAVFFDFQYKPDHPNYAGDLKIDVAELNDGVAGQWNGSSMLLSDKPSTLEDEHVLALTKNHESNHAKNSMGDNEASLLYDYAIYMFPPYYSLLYDMLDEGMTTIDELTYELSLDKTLEEDAQAMTFNPDFEHNLNFNDYGGYYYDYFKDLYLHEKLNPQNENLSKQEIIEKVGKKFLISFLEDDYYLDYYASAYAPADIQRGADYAKCPTFCNPRLVKYSSRENIYKALGRYIEKIQPRNAHINISVQELDTAFSAVFEKFIAMGEKSPITSLENFMKADASFYQTLEDFQQLPEGLKLRYWSNFTDEELADIDEMLNKTSVPQKTAQILVPEFSGR